MWWAKALTPSTIFNNDGVKTDSGGQEGNTQNSHLELPYTAARSSMQWCWQSSYNINITHNKSKLKLCEQAHIYKPINNSHLQDNTRSLRNTVLSYYGKNLSNVEIVDYINLTSTELGHFVFTISADAMSQTRPAR